MIDLTVDEAKLERAVKKARERNVVIPTFRQMKDPEKHTPQKMKDRLKGVGLWDVDSANLFRITQTEEKLRSKNIVGKENACNAHYEVGLKVRQTMKELSGIMPEASPTPSVFSPVSCQWIYPASVVKYARSATCFSSFNIA